MCACIWCTFVHWSLTFGVGGFFGPVTFEITFEIYCPGPVALEAYNIMEAWYSKRNEAGLNLSAKDLTNKIFISITNNDTVMWYTMHIFYI